MKYKLLFATLLALISTNITLAETPMSKYLSKLKIIENEDGKIVGNGRKIETFEDVYIPLNPFNEENKEYPIVDEEKIPEGYVSEKEAKKYFKKFKSHAILTDEEITFIDFFNEHFSLDGVIREFPTKYYGTTPGTFTYKLQMDDNYKYVSTFHDYAPDAVSCIKDTSLCGSECDYKHKNQRNIYSKFKENILSKAIIKDAEEVNSENNHIKMIFKKRTPPLILFNGAGGAETSNGFPVLGGDLSEGGGISTYACTSSDWYKTPMGIIIKNNNPADKLFFAKFTFGRFGECPQDGQDWTDYELWTNLENIVRIDWDNSIPTVKTTSNQSGKTIPYFQDVVKFTNFDGYIRYSIFAKEKDPNDEVSPVNPSIIVSEDDPTNGYGYQAAGDLGDTIETAVEWPEKSSLGAIARPGQTKGLLRVYDNDQPNIIIRITNMDTEEEMFFPPCLASSSTRISLSSKYKAISGPGKTNKDDYDFFVENLGPDYDYKALIDVPELRPYYTIYSIDDENIKTQTEGSYIERMLLNKDPKFINQNVRVEDYFSSDTAEDGEKTFKSDGSKYYKGSFGRRHGTCSKMAALFENTGSFRFKTDVEYKLDVWTDDNIKWSNVEYPESFTGGPQISKVYVENSGIRDSGGNDVGPHEQLEVGKAKLSATAKVYDTGIKKGIIELNIPDNSENLNESQDIDITKHINGGIYFTFKNPTPRSGKLETVKDLESNGFPSVRVVVQDYAGLNRELRLFFRVNDRNIDIKTLEGNK